MTLIGDETIILGDDGKPLSPGDSPRQVGGGASDEEISRPALKIGYSWKPSTASSFDETHRIALRLYKNFDDDKNSPTVHYGFCYNKDAAKIRVHNCFEEKLYKNELSFIKDRYKEDHYYQHGNINLVLKITWKKDVDDHSNSTQSGPNNESESKSKVIIFTRILDNPESETRIDPVEPDDPPFEEDGDVIGYREQKNDVTVSSEPEKCECKITPSTPAPLCSLYIVDSCLCAKHRGCTGRSACKSTCHCQKNNPLDCQEKRPVIVAETD